MWCTLDDNACGYVFCTAPPPTSGTMSKIQFRHWIKRKSLTGGGGKALSRTWCSSWETLIFYLNFLLSSCKIVQKLKIIWISWLWNVSGPMVWQNYHGLTISTHPSLVLQLFKSIGPLLSQRFQSASAKAQPRGGFLPAYPIILTYTKGT